MQDNEPANVSSPEVVLPLPPLPPGQPPVFFGGPPWGPYPSPYLDYAFVPITGPRPPRVWTVFVAYVVAFIGAQVVGGIVLLAAVMIEHGQELTSPANFAAFIQPTLSEPDVLLLFLLAMQVTLIATALGAAWLSPTPIARRLRLGPSTVHPAAYPLVVLGAIAIGVLFEFVTMKIPLPPNKDLQFLTETLQHLTPWQTVAAVLVVGGGPAFGEELLFRGYMQSRLSRRWGRWAAIPITTVLFGIMHLNLVQGTFAAIFGVYLGYLADKSGSIRPSMACHFANNAFQVILARYGPALNPSPAAVTILAGAMAILLCAAIAYLVFALPPAPQPPEPVEIQPSPYPAYFPPPGWLPPAPGM